MAETLEKSVLQRMAAARAVKVSPTAMTIAKALRIALAKAGNEALDTAVGIRQLDEGTHVPEGLTDHLPDNALYIMLRGPGAATGVAIVCPQVVGAVIEATTMGKVLKRESVERTATATDAALTSVFLSPALETFGLLAHDCYPPLPFQGYVCDAMLTDGRAAQMVLADAAHLRVTADVDFGLGAKIGKLTLILPEELQVMPSSFSSKEDWKKNMEKAVMNSTANLEAVLYSLTIPISEIAEWKIDQTIPLTTASVEAVKLQGPNGASVLHGKLGRAGAMRAVKLSLGRAKPAQMQAMPDNATPREQDINPTVELPSPDDAAA